MRASCRLAVAAEFESPAGFMARDDQGAVYVSDPRGGIITRYTHPDGDGPLERRTTFVAGRSTAHGMQWHDGWLWFPQTGEIWGTDVCLEGHEELRGPREGRPGSPSLPALPGMPVNRRRPLLLGLDGAPPLSAG